MSMTKCSECGREISDRATVCPNCGNPTKAQTNLTEGNVVTIQKTFKKWKAVKLVSVLAIVIGILSFAGGDIMKGIGVLSIFLGIIGLIISRLGAWWTTG